MVEKDINNKEKTEKLRKYFFAKLKIFLEREETKQESLIRLLEALPPLKRYPLVKGKGKGIKDDLAEITLSKPKRDYRELDKALVEDFEHMFFSCLSEIAKVYLKNTGLPELDQESSISTARGDGLRIVLCYLDLAGEESDRIRKFLHFLSLVFSQRLKSTVKKYYENEIGVDNDDEPLFNCGFENIDKEREKRFLVIENLLNDNLERKRENLTPALHNHLKAIHVNVLELSDYDDESKIFICMENIIFSKSHVDMFFKNRIISACPCGEGNNFAQDNTFYSHQYRLKSKIKKIIQD